MDTIRTTLGEYIDREAPPAEWDLGGLLQWARRAYKVATLSQNQLRKMDPAQIEDTLAEAARADDDTVELDGIAIYLDPKFAVLALAEWARTKFNIQTTAEEIGDKSKEEIKKLFDDRVHDAYKQREISYPVEGCLERMLGDEGTNNAASANAIVSWANAKFDAGWTLADVQGRSRQELYDTLTGLNREWLDGRMEREVHKHVVGRSRDTAVEWEALCRRRR
jgi:hypothetical protein